MRKTVLIVALALALPMSLYAAERMVLGELFTNTGCGPCVAANNVLDDIVAEHDTLLVVIRYHTWWPWGSDPFYRANIIENRNRTEYYGADYVPHFWIDGIIDAGSSSGSYESLILGRAPVSSPLIITLLEAYDPDGRTGGIEAKIVATDPITWTNLRLHFVLTESDIYEPSPNGLQWHDETMRDMIPDEVGESISLTQGDTLYSSREYEVHPDWDVMNCDLVVFVQSNTTKEVLQAAVIDVGTTIDRKPMIHWVERSPFIPASDDSLLITAEVTDDYAVDEVRIRFTADGADTTFVSMQEVAPDTFEGYIPSQADGAFIEFLVTASDSGLFSKQVFSDLDEYFNGVCSIEDMRVNDVEGNNIYLGYPLRVTGVATVSTGTFFPQGAGIDVYIQDRPTAGLNIYDPQGTLEVNLGDSVVVEGVLEQYNGNLRMVPLGTEFITVVGPGTVPEPVSIGPPELDEALEGMLARVDSVVIVAGQWPPEGYGANIEVASFSDTTEKMFLVLDENTDLDGSPEPPYLFSVVGVIRQDDPSSPYDGHYHLAPRGTGDLFPIGDLFIRGDADNNGEVQMADAVYVLKHLYVPGAPDPACFDTGDADDDGTIVMTDVTYVLKHLYVPESPVPPLPYPDCGIDPTLDQLDCAEHQCMP